MAVRVTANEVKEIIETELSNTIIEAYITGANQLVTEVLGTTSLGTDLLKEIERWLSAHMMAISRERQAMEEGAGGAYIKYSGSYGEALKSTSYGQMVLALDTTGTFASLSGKSARIFAIESFDS
jgi:hypothetical protein